MEQALHYKSLGWPGYKIHPAGRPDADISNLRSRAARRGRKPRPYARCFVLPYKFGDAVRVGRALEELRFRWYEDPLGENDVYNYAKLCRKLGDPDHGNRAARAAGFNSISDLAHRAAGDRDFLRGDVPIKGGITTMIDPAHLAEAFGLNYEVHHGGNSLNNVAGLHVALASRQQRVLRGAPARKSASLWPGRKTLLRSTRKA